MIGPGSNNVSRISRRIAKMRTWQHRRDWNSRGYYFVSIKGRIVSAVGVPCIVVEDESLGGGGETYA